jgi:hypothetical protein
MCPDVVHQDVLNEDVLCEFLIEIEDLFQELQRSLCQLQIQWLAFEVRSVDLQILCEQAIGIGYPK